ncbi:hypothetical protein SI65_01475 [Aspergillus cristatus]|uniref:Uncharacterized protein n=1 Tax=Aspergillus cristatus TaxID=573508 RepID=A0A1E3BSI1_ASPCR|nr:hypothetical protein SI65_01475 [Aspergillus cristatus]
MAEHLIGLIQDLQSKGEPYDPAFDSFKNKRKKPSSYHVDRALDALANVLVSEKTEVFAVAARMAHDKLNLTITANFDPKEKTIKHTQRIWEYLNTLGDEYARMQRQQKCPQTHDGDDDEDDAPPPKPSKEGKLFNAQRLIAEDFKRYMYEHSLQNLLQRLHGRVSSEYWIQVSQARQR